jgi:hypothetical protein
MSKDHLEKLKSKTRQKPPAWLQKTTIFRDKEVFFYEEASKDTYLRKMGQTTLTQEERDAFSTNLVPTVDIPRDEREELVNVGQQLPLFLDNNSFQANVILRSSLFSATKHRTKRKHYKDWEPVCSLFSDACLVSYKGDRLTAWDHWVLLKLISLRGQSGRPIDEVHEVSTRSILKGSKEQMNTRGYKKVTSAIEALYGAQIRITDRVQNRHLYVRFMSGTMAHKSDTRQWLLGLNPSLLKLLYPQSHTFINLQHLANIRSPLGKWMFGFVSSLKCEKKPIALDVEMLAALSGSSYSTIGEFKSKLVSECVNLQEMGILKSFSTDRNRVLIQRHSRKQLSFTT